MRQHQRRIVTAVVAMLLPICGWLAMSAAPPERATELIRLADWPSQTWFPLDGSERTIACELPPGQRYRLVLGCLGNATQEHEVTVRLQTLPAKSQIDHQIFSTVRPLLRRGSTWAAPAREVRASLPTFAGTHLPLVAAREFSLHVTDGCLDDPRQYAKIRANNVACGARVRIFVDQQLANGEIAQSRIDELVDLLETDVLPRVQAQFGQLSDVDGDGCLSILLTPWLSRLQGGRTSIGGMVRSSDFQQTVPPPLGNCCDLIFLNSNLPSSSALRDLLSHEVAHAACISQRLSPNGDLLRDEEDWLSEALAHLAEPGWSNLDHRLAAYLDDPSRYPLVVPDYYAAGLWRNSGCRGATYLFARWCVGCGDPGLVRKLARCTKRGTRNVERVMDRSFAELFREWTLSLASNDELAAADLLSVLQRTGSADRSPEVCHAGCLERRLKIRGTAFDVIDLMVEESLPQVLHISHDSNSEWQFSICRWPENSQDDPSSNSLTAHKR